MMKPSSFRPARRGAIVALALSLSILAVPAIGAGDSGADPMALSALSDLPGVLDASSGAATSSDGDSAIVAQPAGIAVDVPKDPSAGVTVDPATGPPVNVGVPNADQAGDAVPIAPGVVVYPDAGPSAAVAVQIVPAAAEAPAPPPADTTATDPATEPAPSDATPPAETVPLADSGAADPEPAVTTPQADVSTPDVTDTTTPADMPAVTDSTTTTPTPDPVPAEPAPAAAPAPAPAPTASSLGGVRLMTMLQDSEAPTDYAFTLSIPDGGSIASDGNGGYDIVDAAGTATLHVASPWARDANDASLPVSYSLDGSTLTMHIDTSGATFPVVADPLLTAAVSGSASTVTPAAASAAPSRQVPAPTPPKPAEKPELQCAGGASNGAVTTSCSIHLGLWAAGGRTDFETASILVRCKNCGEDQLTRLARFYGSMLNWKEEVECGTNCTKGRSAASTSYEVVKTTVMVAQQQACNVMVGRLLVRKMCTVLVAQTRTTIKTVTHYTCALNLMGGALTKVSSDTYAISGAFSLSCPDGGGTATGSIESSDFRNAVLGLSA